YEVPAVYQERLLKFCRATGEAIVIKAASADAFYAWASGSGGEPGGEKPSYARRLEDALNDVMGSRATKHYVSRDFEKNVHAWLTRESGQIRIMHNSENGF